MRSSFFITSLVAAMLGLGLLWAVPAEAHHVRFTNNYRPPVIGGHFDPDIRFRYRMIAAHDDYFRATGWVTHIDDDSLTLRGRGRAAADHSYWLQEGTLIVDRDRREATYGNIKLGDRVTVWSPGMEDGEAVMIQDHAVYHAFARGWIDNLNHDHETLRLLIKRGNAVSHLTASAMPHTEYDLRGHGDFSQLDEGDRVTVFGTYNLNTRIMTVNRVEMLLEGDERCLAWRNHGTNTDWYRNGVCRTAY